MDAKEFNKRHGFGVVLGLVFLSGFAALVYQVLWMKQIGLLFGNTSHAASATLASFFAGLATGSWFIGRRVSTSRNPMRTYAWLEVAIAVSALLYFVILALFKAIYPAIYQSVESDALMLVIKFGLSLLLVFPPAFCMGGTIPVIGQYMVTERQSFGAISATMYGLNTLGAAVGAGIAGFFLPIWIGFNATCGLAIAVSCVIAIVAFGLSRKAIGGGFQQIAEEEQVTEEVPERTLSRQERRRMEREAKRGKKVAALSTVEVKKPTTGGRMPILILSFFSGFGVLALEVLWTRLFSQVLDNSVYSFSVILVVVLIGLALGALFSSFLARLKGPPYLILTVLIIVGSIAVALTPSIFMAMTNGMEVIAFKGSWGSYIALVSKTVLVTVGPPALLLGTIFPYLMKLEERHLKSPGLSLGYLATANTVGAILGAVVCGFLLLDGLGMWSSLQTISVIYLFAAILVPLDWDLKSIGAKAACVVVLAANIIALDSGSLPVMSTDPNAREEKVVELWEGSGSNVLVTESEVGLSIRINSRYSLGSTGAYMQEKFQTDLPLMVFPDTEEIFFLGVGTGITAGAALDRIKYPEVKKIVACELVPEVITAAKKYMTDVPRKYMTNMPEPIYRSINGDTTGGLFTDSRATVLVEDGRHYLMASEETFDMINADLFVPFRSGAGSLYSHEHFMDSKERLDEDGVFVQWLPLYQLTEYEFSVIAKTMLGVFDQVSMWRHNFQPGYEYVALIGHCSKQPLPASQIDSRQDKLMAVSGMSHYDLFRMNLPLNEKTILLFYAGNLTQASSLFDDYPINTDNRPIIEYMAPRSYREQDSGQSPWFTEDKFADFVDKVLELSPPDQDPLLVERDEANRRLPLAGSAFHRACLAYVNGNEEAAREAWQKFVTEWLDQ